MIGRNVVAPARDNTVQISAMASSIRAILALQYERKLFLFEVYCPQGMPLHFVLPHPSNGDRQATKALRKSCRLLRNLCETFVRLSFIVESVL